MRGGMDPRLPLDEDEHDAFGNPDPVCNDFHDDFSCTRPRGHTGAHVAGDGTGHVVDRWAWGRPCCENCSCNHTLEGDDACTCEYVDDRRIGSQHPYTPRRGGGRAAKHHGRAVPGSKCRRCGSASTGGRYCPRGCGPI